MRYLTSALISEGITDDRFMSGLLSRILADICATEFDDSVEIADVLVLRNRCGPSSVPEILSLVDANPRTFMLVFVHRDQGANARRTEEEWLRPLKRSWGQRIERLVCVVPVREMEAWVLADGDALRRALGVSWSDSELGVPVRRAAVEDISDPKKALALIEPRIGRGISNYFERLGELVSLKRLGEIPAYQRLLVDVRNALAELGYR